MVSLTDSSKRRTDGRINRPGTHSPDFYQLQNLLLQEQASSTHLPQRLAPGKAMVHMSNFKDYHDQSGNKNALLEACRHGSVADVRHLIDQGTDANSKDVHGRTCILLCSTSLIEPIEKIDFLRSKGGYIPDIDDENNSILHLACDLGTLKTVQYLVNIGLDINTKGFRSRSCIMACSQSKTQATDKIKLLRKMGGNIHDTDVKDDGMLHLACKWGTLDTVRYLINQGLDINTKGRYGRTCILLCSQSETQAIEKIELLMSKGVNIYDTDTYNCGMLHLAGMAGTLETVRYLTDQGLNVNAKNINGQTCILKCGASHTQAIEKIELLRSNGGNIYDKDNERDGMLHMACADGTLDTVRYLVDLGLDINAKGFNGRTCLLHCGQSEIQPIDKIEFLRLKGSNINDTDNYSDGILHLACAFGKLDTVRHLVGLGLDINARGFKSRRCVLQCSQSYIHATEKIEFLRSKGAIINDRDDQNNGMLHLACACGTLGTVKHLVDLGLDINTKGFNGRTCILQCSEAKTQTIKKIEFLRSKGGNINDRDDKNNGMLQIACAFGKLDTVRHLVGLGLDINTKGFHSRTCILQCSQSRTDPIEKIELLRSKGGNIYDIDDKNRGILDLACISGTLDTVRYLIDLGLDVNTKGINGVTCILKCGASQIQSIEKIELLRSKGGNIDDRDDDNKSILHIACAFGTLDTVQYLVHLGLDPNSKDKSGNTPVSFMLKSGVQSPKKLKYLISAGAKLSWLERLTFVYHSLF
ncbi:putative ankyrin repeat protein RF_0381 [Patella vulgata]|uniref:putative ankyrin repeat protein RF_0381 n=1 Tax=Patella vulgata TaxID=6465 RepID=UPI00217F9D6B|nr:putative ankyrin repeat protein RF_0381 [Patella vulgata]